MSALTIRRENVGRSGPARPWRIAHLSDLHLWFGRRRLTQIDGILDQSQPDLVAMTGDYADTPAGWRMVTAWVSDLGRRWPVAWIAGNHDWWWGCRRLSALARVEGCHWVDSGDMRLERDDGNICHVSDWKRSAREQWRHMPRHPNERRITLVHDPSTIDPARVNSIDLILAGHLHGGQVVLGMDREGRSLPAGWFYRWCGGRWGIGESTLIVSRGLGDTLPLRFRCPKEVVLIELR